MHRMLLSLRLEDGDVRKIHRSLIDITNNVQILVVTAEKV